MTLTPSTRLFFDASCLFTAADSPEWWIGVSCHRLHPGYLQAVVSPGVLIEAERNIVDKRSVDVFRRYRQLVSATPFMLVPSPAEEAVHRFEAAFLEDAHVLASALAGQAEFLSPSTGAFNVGSNSPG